MSQRFIRCGHCGIPHDGQQVFCPSTGKAIRTKSRRAVEREAPPVPSAALASLPTRPVIPAPASSRRALPRRLIGKTIGGKYVVRSILGEGGMGTVFEAEHLALGRLVAVKILHARQATKKDAVRRFQHEARAAAAIGHPNICGVIDLGSLDDGSPYIVMERLVGETLADRIASEGGLPFEDVIDILVQVLSGLVAAHEQRIVHRDIKPENIFLTTRVGCPPLVKLLDFGVSKIAGLPIDQRVASSIPSRPPSDEVNLTRTGMVMGTPYYMAPEQARGERDLDSRVDLYACGVILYESLTGKRPFSAHNYNALLAQVLSATPRPASELRPALPAPFGVVIEKAMARRCEDRYGTAAEFQRDLQALRDRYNAPLTSAAFEVMRAPPSSKHPSLRLRPAEHAQATGAAPVPASREAQGDPTEIYVRVPEPPPTDDADDPTQLMARQTPHRR
jgi:eukaryotic-like serine/threonine-protein kinase